MIWLMIAGMCAVTFVPRVIPLLLGRDLVLPGWIRRWLSFFPYAALGALIFPGILTVVEGRPWIGLAAGAAAALLALKARSAIFPVLAAIAITVILELAAT
ncbi:MAG TPA: AzlD domain-containing protein [Spirochaetia bacterium]|nr:AzlD domain-containing protein [Spirochaetia bacterium]